MEVDHSCNGIMVVEVEGGDGDNNSGGGMVALIIVITVVAMRVGGVEKW